jgi:arylsulfatase A-like enzyme
LELAGANASPELDAVSLKPLLLGGAISRTRDLYFTRREGGPVYGGKSYEAIVRGDWKLLQNDPYRSLELYNLKDDPQEKLNLAPQYPKLVNELTAAMGFHIQRSGGTPWQKPRQYKDQ